MNDKNSKDYIDYSELSKEEMMAEAEAGWKKIPDSQSTDESVERVNSYINKIVNSNKYKRKTLKRPKNQFNNTMYWLLGVFILLIITFFIILKII